MREADAALRVVFDVDSKLVAMQMSRYQPWACRAIDLQEVHADCVRMGAELDRIGVSWAVRHIYRANAAIDDQRSNGPSEGW